MPTEQEMKEEASELIKIAEMQVASGVTEQALRVARKALQLCDEMKDKKMEASVLHTVAGAFLAAGASQEAIRAATREQSVAKEAGDKEMQGSACMMLAQAFLMAKDSKAAAEKATEAAALYKGAGSKAGEAKAQQTLAEAYILDKNGSEALKVAKGAAELFKAAGEDKSGLGCALNAVARAQLLLDDKEAGLKAAREALLLFRQAGDHGGEVAARETCASLRGKAQRDAPPPALKSSDSFVTKPNEYWQPGTNAPPTQCPPETYGQCRRLCATAETRMMAGKVCIVTGASRSLGKGIAQILAESGATVYVTGRSTAKNPTNEFVKTTVDELVQAWTKIGGNGVAAHMDHTQASQNYALASLIAQNHGRVDVCVNNAATVPLIEDNFMSTAIFQQPMRYLHEQMAVGVVNHVAMTMLLMPCLRRGEGLVVNVSKEGAQSDVSLQPVSFFCAKAALERMAGCMAEQMRNRGMYVFSMLPGIVHNEKRKLMKQMKGQLHGVHDAETTRFSGHAVVTLSVMPQDAKRYLSMTRRILEPADLQMVDADGYCHEGNLSTKATGGRIPDRFA